MTDELSQAAESKKLTPIQAPALSATNFKLVGTGTDFVLILERVVPMYDSRGNTDDIAMLQPVATVTLSPGAAKDLSLLLADQVARHEADFGVISTPFTKKRASK